MSKSNIKETLNKRGIKALVPTEAKLKEMGISHGRWLRIARGESAIKVKEALAIAEFLKCDLDEIVKD